MGKGKRVPIVIARIKERGVSGVSFMKEKWVLHPAKVKEERGGLVPAKFNEEFKGWGVPYVHTSVAISWSSS